MSQPFFTIGHSTRTIAQFVALLRAGNIQAVVDVRTVPRSRTNPQFNHEELANSLIEFQLAYCRIAELGGLRGRAAETPPGVNGWWKNRSFHNYADHALTPAFRAGLGQLLALGRSRRAAIMCAEALWWRCHRRIIADYLIAAGAEVVHLMDGPRLEPARLSAGASVSGGMVTYPAVP